MDQSVGDVLLERPRLASRSVIVLNDPDHGRMVANIANTVYQPGDKVLARTVDDQFVGGVLYQEYTGRSVWMHMGSVKKGWCTREMLISIFHFPFVGLRCYKLFAKVPEWKMDALRYNLRVGFKVETFVEDVYNEGGVFLISMTRPECKWVNPDE